MAEIGFIGLGIMGRPMAGHLIKAGHRLFVYDVNPKAVERAVAMGAAACSAGKETAQKSDIIITMLPDTPDVAAALFGPGGVAEGVKSGSIVVDMSSISPVETREFAASLKKIEVAMLDAPVSGGQSGAENATLSIMVGGPADVFEKVRPYLEKLGKKIVHLGDIGAGQTCKAANQILVALTIEAVAETLLFAAKAGVDPGKVREALLGGAAQSRILELHGERMIKRTFDPGFRIRLHQKDLNIALQAARRMGLSLPNTATAQELFNCVAANEGDNLDNSAMVLALERMANYKVGG